MIEKGIKSARQSGCETAYTINHAAFRLGTKATCKAFQFFESANKFADCDVFRETGKLHPAITPTRSGDVATRLQLLCDLGEMVARYSIRSCNVVDRKAFALRGEGHENAQGIVAVKAQLHKIGISDIVFMNKRLKSVF